MQTRTQHIQTEYLYAVQQTISNWIAKSMDRTSLVSVTQCIESENGGSITVYISTFPIERNAGALSYLRRHADEIARELRNRFPRRRTPFLNFVTDIAAPTVPTVPQE